MTPLLIVRGWTPETIANIKLGAFLKRYPMAAGINIYGRQELWNTRLAEVARFTRSRPEGFVVHFGPSRWDSYGLPAGETGPIADHLRLSMIAPLMQPQDRLLIGVGNKGECWHIEDLLNKTTWSKSAIVGRILECVGQALRLGLSPEQLVIVPDPSYYAGSLDSTTATYARTKMAYRLAMVYRELGMSLQANCWDNIEEKWRPYDVWAKAGADPNHLPNCAVSYATIALVETSRRILQAGLPTPVDGSSAYTAPVMARMMAFARDTCPAGRLEVYAWEHYRYVEQAYRTGFGVGAGD